MIATTTEQSKRLAEKLPVESADMCWCNSSVRGVNYTDPWHIEPKSPIEVKEILDEAFTSWDTFWKIVPAWSLSALQLLPCIYGTPPALCRGNITGRWYVWYENQYYDTQMWDDPIDSVVEAIEHFIENGVLNQVNK